MTSPSALNCEKPCARRRLDAREVARQRVERLVPLAEDPRVLSDLRAEPDLAVERVDGGT